MLTITQRFELAKDRARQTGKPAGMVARINLPAKVGEEPSTEHCLARIARTLGKSTGAKK
jgi:hypothetical protein